ncbi:MAG: PQQ-dependent sugar dehydrogenase [Methylococcales bacterium]|nr:PQQ-dependent sugar dehydrogenase [Methylococcales bacterium]
MKVAGLLKFLTLLLVGHVCQAASPEHEAVLRQLHLPPGFKISIYAENMPSARSLALGDDGVVFVGSRNGEVYALRDADHNGYAEQRHVLAEKLYMPNGVAYKDGALYVAEVNRIIRFDDIVRHLGNPPSPAIVYAKFPTDRHHGWKYLRFGPDGKLYTAVGAPCNICKPEKTIYASLLRMDANGGNMEILAHGIRNTVGFDWQPGSGHLFFNDNGRDYLGDDAPPEELNRWSHPGEDFGYPYCHGGDIADPQYGNDGSCQNSVPPIWKYKAHIAPLGMRFYTGDRFPAHYRQQLFVAQHGSWNRSQPQGYQISVIHFADDRPVSEEAFITGWLTANNETLGRPVDILQLPDGSLLISDDKLGVVYRLEYIK